MDGVDLVGVEGGRDCSRERGREGGRAGVGREGGERQGQYRQIMLGGPTVLPSVDDHQHQPDYPNLFEEGSERHKIIL